jgi:hypothetical protein
MTVKHLAQAERAVADFIDELDFRHILLMELTVDIHENKSGYGSYVHGWIICEYIIEIPDICNQPIGAIAKDEKGWFDEELIYNGEELIYNGHDRRFRSATKAAKYVVLQTVLKLQAEEVERLSEPLFNDLAL